MPIVNGAYDAPTWNNNAPPAIDAAELQDMCDTIETYNTQKADVDYVNTFVRPNLLDNWYFVGGGSQQDVGKYPINQRGSTSYADGTSKIYGIDRWYSARGTVEIIVGGLNVSWNGVNGTQAYLQQIVENYQLQGKELTATMLFSDGTLITGTRTQTTTASANTNYYDDGTDYINCTSFTEGHMSFVYLTTRTTPKTIVAIKLELGDTQTLAHWDGSAWVLNEVPNYQQELARCQRYCVAIPEASGAYASFAEGIADSTTSVGCILTLPVPMRTTPTLSSTGSFRLSGGTSMSTIAVTGLSVYSSSANPGGALIGIKATVASGLSVGYPYILLRSNSSEAKILLSADL